jgi:hypothetical protein
LPNTLSTAQLHQLARYGAQARLEELRAEIAALRALIGGAPASAQGSKPRRRRRRGKLSAAGRAAIAAAQKARWAKARRGSKKQTARRKRKGMSAAARKAVSERMRKYWASKRAQKTRGGAGN